MLDEIKAAPEEPWWKQHDSWLQAEYTALDEAGIAYERDEEAFAQGVARLHLRFVAPNGEVVPLVVTYPDLYPYFRFEVQAPTLTLEHHQSPDGKGLCLIGRGTEHWNTKLTVAQLLQEQFAKLWRTGLADADSDDAAEIADLEQNQAEPFGAYYQYHYAPSLVLVDHTWKIPPQQQNGTFVIAVDEPRAGTPKGALRGTMIELRGEKGELLGEAPPLMGDVEKPIYVEGLWFRLAARIQEFEPDNFLSALLKQHPQARTAPICRLQDGSHLKTWGVLYPEEIGHRVTGEGWVFVYAFSSERHAMNKGFVAPRLMELQKAASQRATQGKRAKKRR